MYKRASAEPEIFVDRDIENRPSRYRALREGGRSIWIEIPPHHPRFSMALAPEIKAATNEEERYTLAELLQGWMHDALCRWPDEPIHTHVPGFGVVSLCESPDQRGKVLVRPVKSSE